MNLKLDVTLKRRGSPPSFPSPGPGCLQQARPPRAPAPWQQAVPWALCWEAFWSTTWSQQAAAACSRPLCTQLWRPCPSQQQRSPLQLCTMSLPSPGLCLSNSRSSLSSLRGSPSSPLLHLLHLLLLQQPHLLLQQPLLLQQQPQPLIESPPTRSQQLCWLWGSPPSQSSQCQPLLYRTV